MNPTLFGRGAGEGRGVHICTVPVTVRGAQPGDILEVHILDARPQRRANPLYKALYRTGHRRRPQRARSFARRFAPSAELCNIRVSEPRLPTKYRGGWGCPKRAEAGSSR
jgi:hypothetical protein